MRAVGQWVLIFAFLFSLSTGLSLFTAPPAAAGGHHDLALQGTAIQMVSPANCPEGGCAGGQRLNMHFGFELSRYDAALPALDNLPNVKVCFYVPAGWGVSPSSVGVAGAGAETGSEYLQVNGCLEDNVPPDDYQLIAGLEAKVTKNAFSDSLDLSFRLGAGGSGKGHVLARLFERNGEGWARTLQSFTGNITVVRPESGKPVYVASDPQTCGSNSPCYVNSADDLPGGIGTGLKDAVDAAQPNADIVLIGTYPIKSQTVVIDKPLTLRGTGDAALTYNSATGCDAAMLSIAISNTPTGSDRMILRDLNINDGQCAEKNRKLVLINSKAPVDLISNDLTGGDNAVEITGNSGAVNIFFNHITGNAGYAVYWHGSPVDTPMNLIANNLAGNRHGMSVDCLAGSDQVAANRKADHNYWGDNFNAAETHCSIDPNKRLGGQIALKPDGPGVSAQQVTVTEEKKAYFDNQIALKRNGGQNFDLYLVDHGYAREEGLPFTRSFGTSPNPCSNTWTLFTPDGTNPGDAELEVSLKYDKTSACQTVINSSLYCDQTANPEKYPLYWYDPFASPISRVWRTTGQKTGDVEGQPTSCDIAANEVRVKLDTSGKPDTAGSLANLPLMAGIPVLKSFLPLASHERITVTWSTNNEPDVQGFYILRSQDNSPFVPISDLIPRKGSALWGATYNDFVDGNKVNGVLYTYRLKIVRTDGQAIYSDLFEIAANPATITPTPTITPTYTVTVTRTPAPALPTRTPTFTRVPTRLPTMIPSRTPTVRFATPTRTLIPVQSGSITATNGTPAPGTLTPSAETAAPDSTTTPGTGTPDDMLSSTPTPAATATPTPTALAPGRSGVGSPWLSLLIGLAAGSVSIAGAFGVWQWIRVRR